MAGRIIRVGKVLFCVPWYTNTRGRAITVVCCDCCRLASMPAATRSSLASRCGLHGPQATIPPRGTLLGRTSARRETRIPLCPQLGYFQMFALEWTNLRRNVGDLCVLGFFGTKLRGIGKTELCDGRMYCHS